MRTTSVRKFYYHVTPKCEWKERVKLFPRDNNHPGVNGRDDDEPNDARICVSPSVEQCLSAVYFTYDQRIYVYRTLRRVFAAHPYHVLDSRLTGERWLLKPTVFIKVGCFNGEVLYKLQPNESFEYGVRNAAEQMIQRKYLQFVRRRLASIISWDNENGGQSWLRT